MAQCTRCGGKARFMMSLCLKCIDDLAKLTPEQREKDALDHPAPRLSRLAAFSLFFGIVWLAGLGSIAAIVCGHLAKQEIRRSPTRIAGKRMATIGLILGYAGVLVISVSVILGFRERARLPQVYEASMRTVLRNLATVQDAYHDAHQTYTSDLDALDYNRLVKIPGVTVRIEKVSASGWAAIASHVRSGKTCSIYHGDRAEFGLSGSTQSDVPECR